MYTPSREILDKYADLLICFALNEGRGIAKGEVVYLQVPECAKPLLISLRRSVLKAGGHPIVHLTPDGMQKEFFELASNEQLSFFPSAFLKGRVDQMDHLVGIIADYDMHELEGIEPTKIMTHQRALRPYMQWREKKGNEGKFHWTLALYGTEAMAKEAGISIEDYWQQIIEACYLDEKDPISKWRVMFKEIDRVKHHLNSLAIEHVHVTGEGTDLKVKLGKEREWLAGDGCNIPSYEVFISPDWRGTEGRVRFNQPLYRYGNLIENVTLVFKGGRVVQASASKGEEILKAMVATEGADKIGEFSLTDSRLSRITRFMAETLFDENRGGVYGNMHLALGNAYKDSYTGNLAQVSKEEWASMGYNESVVHTDIVSTEKRTVTAHLENGKKLVIYEDGKFVF